LVRKVEQALRRAGAGGALIVAVSGGPDSVALLRALHEARSAGPLRAAGEKGVRPPQARGLTPFSRPL
jgi:tRNA(Ile)-lysidine synthase TilS/MesJ